MRSESDSVLPVPALAAITLTPPRIPRIANCSGVSWYTSLSPGRAC